VNKDQKAAVVEEVAERIQSSEAIFAIDYRGLSVKQAVELRQQLSEAGAGFQVVKNRLTIRAADKAGAEGLKELLVGPTAFTYVQGDPAVAAKAIATFRRQNNLLEFKGGTLEGELLTVDQLEGLAKLPARDVLQGQFVGVLASPITGLVRGLASMIGGLASQLGQIRDQGLVQGEAPAEEPPPAEETPAAEETSAAAEEETPAKEEAPAAEEEEAPPAEETPAAEEPPAEEPPPAAEPAASEEAATPADDDATAAEAADAEPEETPADEAPGDPVAEAEAAEEETPETSETPSEGENTEPEEG
jgi:large subunit ribosomal protein L10